MPVFGFSKKGEKNSDIPMVDIDGNALKAGDEVISLRYGPGRSLMQIIDGEYYYESLETHEKIGWVRMVDAITRRQKGSKV